MSTRQKKSVGARRSAQVQRLTSRARLQLEPVGEQLVQGIRILSTRTTWYPQCTLRRQVGGLFCHCRIVPGPVIRTVGLARDSWPQRLAHSDGDVLGSVDTARGSCIRPRIWSSVAACAHGARPTGTVVGVTRQPLLLGGARCTLSQRRQAGARTFEVIRRADYRALQTPGPRKWPVDGPVPGPRKRAP